MKLIRIYEEFVDKISEMNQITSQLMNRINYWFTAEDSAFSKVNFVDMQSSTTPNSPHKTIIFDFNDEEHVYKVLITLSVEDLEKCNLNIYRYDSIDPFNQNPPKLEFKDIEVNNIKEDFITQKIAKFDEMDENPDKNRIETKEPEEPGKEGEMPSPPLAPPQGGGPSAPPATGAPPVGGLQGGAPAAPPQGGMPTAQTTFAPPQGGMNF